MSPGRGLGVRGAHGAELWGSQRGPRGVPAARGTADSRGNRGRGWAQGGRGPHALRAGRGIPWVWAAHGAASFPGRPPSSLAPARGSPCGPGAVIAMTRRGAGGLALSPGARAGRAAAPKRGARPHPGGGSRAGARSQGEVGAGVAPGSCGHIPDRERPPSPACPACPARPTHCGSAEPGRGPRLPAPPGALGWPRHPGLCARPAAPRTAPSGARSPCEIPLIPVRDPRARSPGSPPRFPPGTRAARTPLGASARGEVLAPEREGVGSAGRKGSAGAGLGEGGGEDGERERRRKGAREGRHQKMIGGREGQGSQGRSLFLG